MPAPRIPRPPPGLHEVPGGICYREALSPVARGFVLAMALCMFVMSAAFAVLGRWTELSAATLALALFVLAPALLGLVFLRMGLTAAKQIVFDARHRVLRVTWQGLLGGWGRRASTLPIAAVTDVTVQRCTGLEDPDSFLLCLHVAGRRRPYRLGMLDREAEALRWQARLREMLDAQETVAPTSTGTPTGSSPSNG